MKTVFETIKKYLPKAKKQFAMVIVYVLAITALEASLTVLMSRIISEAEIRGTMFTRICWNWSNTSAQPRAQTT